MAIADGFHVDSNGNLWLGSDRETFDSQTRSEAPFYVWANGDLVANSGTFGGDLSAAGGTFTGELNAASGTFTGELSGGTINIGGNDNSSFHVDSSGNMWVGASSYASAPFKVSSTGALTATSASIGGYLTSSSSLNADNIDDGTLSADRISTDSLNFNKITASSVEIIADMIASNAVLASKIVSSTTQGTFGVDGDNLYAGFGSFSSINVGNKFTGDNTGVTMSGVISINATSGSISGTSGSFSSISGSSLSVSGNVSGAGLVDSANGSDTNIDFQSSFIDLKPNNSLELRIGTTTSTFYGSVNPDQYNTRDLGSSTRRWRDIYTVGAVDTSDVNFKTDIEPLDLGLDFINTLDTIQFKWAETDNSPAGIRTHTGFSAQDIEQKLIDYGVQEKDYALFTNSQITEDPEGPALYGLRTGELISILTKAVQELSAKNDELESRIAALEA